MPPHGVQQVVPGGATEQHRDPGRGASPAQQRGERNARDFGVQGLRWLLGWEWWGWGGVGGITCRLESHNHSPGGERVMPRVKVRVRVGRSSYSHVTTHRISNRQVRRLPYNIDFPH